MGLVRIAGSVQSLPAHVCRCGVSREACRACVHMSAGVAYRRKRAAPACTCLQAWRIAGSVQSLRAHVCRRGVRAHGAVWRLNKAEAPGIYHRSFFVTTRPKTNANPAYTDTPRHGTAHGENVSTLSVSVVLTCVVCAAKNLCKIASTARGRQHSPAPSLRKPRAPQTIDGSQQ